MAHLTSIGETSVSARFEAKDTSEYAFIALIALAVASVLLGVVSLVPPEIAQLTITVPSLALNLI